VLVAQKARAARRQVRAAKVDAVEKRLHIGSAAAPSSPLISLPFCFRP